MHEKTVYKLARSGFIPFLKSLVRGRGKVYRILNFLLQERAVNK